MAKIYLGDVVPLALVWRKGTDLIARKMLVCNACNKNIYVGESYKRLRDEVRCERCISRYERRYRELS